MYRFDIFHLCFIVCACQNSPIINQQKRWSTLPRLIALILTEYFSLICTSFDPCAWELPVATLNCTKLYCTEVCFASFLSSGFITDIVVNTLEMKLAKRTSVYYTANILIAKNTIICLFYVLLWHFGQWLNATSAVEVQFKVVLLYFKWQCGSGVMTQLDGRLRKLLCLTITWYSYVIY